MHFTFRKNACRNSFRGRRNHSVGRLLLWKLVVNTFDIPVHAEDIAIGKRLAGLANHRAILLGDGSGEGIELAGSDGSLRGSRHLGHIIRHVGVRCHGHGTFSHAIPGLLGFPRAIHGSFHPLHIIGSPGINNRRHLGFWRKLDHVRALAKAELWFCIQHEMVLSLADFCVRRTGMLYFNRPRLERNLEPILEEFKNFFTWSDHKVNKEREELKGLIVRSYNLKEVEKQ